MRRAVLILGILYASVMPVGAQTPVTDSNPDRRLSSWQPYIEEAAGRFDLPEEWIGRVLLAESAGETTHKGHPIRSAAGAIGLMQLMPNTYAEMQVAYGLGADPYDPHDNILAGAAYLRTMFDRYGYPGLFAAYNAGPARYEASLRGVPLPAETRIYVSKVTALPAFSIPPQRLFVTLTTGDAPDKSTPTSPIFVPLATARSTTASVEMSGASE